MSSDGGDGVFASSSPVTLAFLGSLLTWVATALGASVVFLSRRSVFSGKWMNAMFGLSAGVMLAASFFSLLLPSLELSKKIGYAGWEPVVIGFALGGLFIRLMDAMVPEDPSSGIFASCIGHSPGTSISRLTSTRLSIEESLERDPGRLSNEENDGNGAREGENGAGLLNLAPLRNDERRGISKKMFLLLLAVTIHNIPEGLALGMAYGGLGEQGAQLHDALVLTIALALQNVPEGIAISVPIRKSGARPFLSFCYGQFSGLVEVPSAVLGAFLVVSLKSILPFALSFAAGAMIYVVCKELIPASHSEGNEGIAGIMLGFGIMMVLDMAFT